MAARSLSFWLAIGSFTLTAAMMHPNFGTLVALVINAALLGMLRWSAYTEGRRRS